MQFGTSVVLLAIVTGAHAVDAQRVRLELRPHAGDTLIMRLDQVTQVDAPSPRRSAAPVRVTTTLRVVSRAIVESTMPGWSTIMTVTDSVHLESTDSKAAAMAEQTRRQLEGRRLRMQVARDGTVSLAADAAGVSDEVAELVSLMPASFPIEAIAVGDTWIRVMPIPQGTRIVVPLDAVVRAQFRLDSIAHDGDIAYLSMRGAVEMGGGAGARATARPARDDDPIAGSVSGSMVVNRRLGWLEESKFLVMMRATLPPASTGAAPMRFRMKITQHMVTSVPRRP